MRSAPRLTVTSDGWEENDWEQRELVTRRRLSTSLLMSVAIVQ